MKKVRLQANRLYGSFFILKVYCPHFGNDVAVTVISAAVKEYFLFIQSKCHKELNYQRQHQRDKRSFKCDGKSACNTAQRGFEDLDIRPLRNDFAESADCVGKSQNSTDKSENRYRPDETFKYGV